MMIRRKTHNGLRFRARNSGVSLMLNRTLLAKPLVRNFGALVFLLANHFIFVQFGIAVVVDFGLLDLKFQFGKGTF